MMIYIIHAVFSFIEHRSWRDVIIKLNVFSLLFNIFRYNGAKGKIYRNEV